MSDTISVWDPSGVEHKVSTANANDLVRHLGWTTKPIGIPEADPTTGPEATPEMYRRGPAAPAELVSVWDREGNEHRMDLSSAIDMERHLGWTRSGIVAQKPAEQAAAPEYSGIANPILERKLAAVPDGEEGIESGANLDAFIPKVDAPTAAEEPTVDDPSAMTREELVSYAKAKFDMDFGEDVSRDDVLNAVLAELD